MSKMFIITCECGEEVFCDEEDETLAWQCIGCGQWGTICLDAGLQIRTVRSRRSVNIITNRANRKTTDFEREEKA